jgi:type I restriction enzyme S subunit
MGENKFIHETEKRLSNKGYSNSRHFPKDSILFVCIGSTIGKCGIAPKELTSNQQINAVFPSERYVTSYLYYNLCISASKIRALAGEQAVPIVNKSQFAETLVALPSTGEQAAIAAALDDVDALIASLDALITKNRDIKHAAMQQLLTGKTRLPGFSGEWEVKRLGEYGDFKGGNGFALKYQGKATGEFPFFKVSDMNTEGNAMFMTNCNHWVSEEVRRLLGATAFPQNSIVFAKIGAAIFLERKKMLVRASCVDNNMMAFVFTRTDADPAFFYYRFLTIELGKLVSTTALPSLNGRDIASLKFGFPSSAEQSAIAAVLSDMDTKLEALEAKRDKTRALKKGMMQELLSGRIRLV